MMSSKFVHTPLRPDLGKEIKRIRDSFKDSQAAFAVRLGRPATDQGLVSKWEKGEKTPSKDDVEKIAEVAGLPLDHFYGEPPDTADRERHEKMIAARWMRRLADELVAATESPEGEPGPLDDLDRTIPEDPEGEGLPPGETREGDG